MAFKTSLVSFYIEKLDDVTHDPTKVTDFSDNPVPRSGAYVQPIVRKTFNIVKEAACDTLSGSFSKATGYLINVNNYLHTGCLTVDAENLIDRDIRTPEYLTLFTRFYWLTSSNTYQVCVEIEEFPGASISVSDRYETSRFLRNDHIEFFAKRLNQDLNLDKLIEFTPLLLRGELAFQRYEYTHSKRVVERDYEKCTVDVESEYQSIRIMESPTMGTTLVLNNCASVSENDAHQSTCFMSHLHDWPGKEVLIMGGGDGTVFSRILNTGVRHVTLVEIDREVLNRCGTHFTFLSIHPVLKDKHEGSRHRIIVDDIRNYLKNCLQSGKKFDYIINDLGRNVLPQRPITAQELDRNTYNVDNPWIANKDIVYMALDSLNPGGVYSTQVFNHSELSVVGSYDDFMHSGPFDVDIFKRQFHVSTKCDSVWYYHITVNMKHNLRAIRKTSYPEMQPGSTASDSTN